MTRYSCGIDFGTTNSTIGLASDNPEVPVRLVMLEENNYSMPTALFYPEMSFSPLLGRKAVQSYIDGYDGRFIRSIKRILGTELMDKYTFIRRAVVCQTN